MQYKTPTIIQMESVECGAAAIGIILAYYGKYVPLEELRVVCGVSRDGVDAYHMLEAAKSYGLEAEGGEVPVGELNKINLPAILYWDENHFVVYEGKDKDRIYINDPATGPRWITQDELEHHYSGVALLFKPGPNFKRGGKQPDIRTTILSRLMPFKRDIITLLVIQACLIALTLVLPMAIQLFLDQILNKSILEWKWVFLGILMGSVAVTCVVTWVQLNFLNYLKARMDLLFSRRFLDHILKLPMQFFMQRFGGEIIQRMRLNSTVANALSGEGLVAALSLFLIIFYALVIWQYDFWLTLIGIVVAVWNLSLLAIVTRIRTVPYARFQQDQAKTTAISLDAIEHIETLKSTGNSSTFFGKIAGFYAKNINALQEIGRKEAWLTASSNFSQQLAIAAVLSIGTWRVMHETLTIGMLVAVQILLFNFLRPFFQLVNLGINVQSLEVDLLRLDDVLRNKVDPLVLERTQKEDVEKLNGPLEFKSITFGYSPLDEPLLKEFSLNIKGGQWKGLKGRIASGKSTLGKLAIGLFKPWSGEVLYDGKDLFGLSRRSLSRFVGYVGEEIVLFAGTIRENLTLWDPHITDEQIVQAAKDACIHEEILSRPNGYQAHLLEDGVNLSQGERQRLEIARILIPQPSFLILDNATSAQDPSTEKQLLTNLKKRGCTALVISNRSNVLEECNEVVEL